MSATVKITQQGPCGHLEYHEAGEVCRCYWEFGGGTVIAIISLPPAEQWDQRYPWARGRRQEVLSFLIDEACRQRAPGALVEWDEARNAVYLKN